MGQLLHQMLWVLVMVVSLEGWLSHGCLEEEKAALLQLKHFLDSPSRTSLPSWREDDADCCSWQRIECNVTTGRVTLIDLSYTRDLELGDWYLNASLFLPFEELNALYLYQNGIVGCVENEGYEKLWELGNLKILDLSSNIFNNGRILISSLSGLSSLKSLYLHNIGLKGSIDIDELNRLRSLENLELGANKIEGFKSFHGGEELLKLNNLEYLGLRDNYLDKNILSSLRGLSSLSYLYIAYNRVNGFINLKELDALSNLKELGLSGNDIHKFIGSTGQRNLNAIRLNNITTYGRSVQLLQSLGGFPNLTTLYLSYNDFKGTIFGELHDFNSLEKLYLDYSSLDENALGSLEALSSLKYLSMYELNGTLPSQGLCDLKHLQELDISKNDVKGILPPCLANLTSLQLLDLSSNQVKIPITLSPFYNLSKLKHLYSHGNEIHAEEEIQNLTPKFQLETLKLDSHGYGGKFPKFLYHQHNLQFVDLSNIKMKGEFPNWLLENNTNLKSLSLANCSLSGPFRLPVHSHTNLSFLNISENYIQGHIPVEIGAYFPRLGSLSMSSNGFNGTIPSSFGNMSSLYALDLSNNNLSGKIPELLTIGCSSLTTLILSNNSLEGRIFSKDNNLKFLSWLQLEGNQFTGSIPDSLSNSSYLSLFDVSNNYLSGWIPEWMGNMPFLEFLNLSRNKLSGSLPAFKSKVLSFVYLSTNKLRGPLNITFYGCIRLVTLDLSHNYLSGGFPEWIGELSQLRFLLLSHNNFEGEIPIQFCKLLQLNLIDLSHNHLYGHILPCLRSSSDPDTYLDVRNHNDTDVSSQQSLEFTTKKLALTYQGSILKYFTGIDLSCNNLTGEIPPEIGNLAEIKVLNLSYNSLTGPIPPTFSNLKEIESLDLSYNKLDGTIPPQLTELYSLEVFSVAHNNLFGKTPERVAQFATFEESSYKDNPSLCGPPLPKSCTSPSPIPRTSSNKEEDSSFIDMHDFYMSFGVGYFMVLLGIATILYINPNWR